MAPTPSPPSLDHRPRWLHGAGDLAISAFCLPGLVLHGLWGGIHLHAMMWLVCLSPLWLMTGMPSPSELSGSEASGYRRWEGKAVRAFFLCMIPVAGIAGVVMADLPVLPMLLALALVLVHVAWPDTASGGYAPTRRSYLVNVRLMAGLATLLLTLPAWHLWSSVLSMDGIPPARPGMWALVASVYFFLSGIGRSLWRPSWSLRSSRRSKSLPPPPNLAGPRRDP